MLHIQLVRTMLTLVIFFPIFPKEVVDDRMVNLPQSVFESFCSFLTDDLRYWSANIARSGQMSQVWNLRKMWQFFSKFWTITIANVESDVEGLQNDLSDRRILHHLVVFLREYFKSKRLLHVQLSYKSYANNCWRMTTNNSSYLLSEWSQGGVVSLNRRNFI